MPLRRGRRPQTFVGVPGVLKRTNMRPTAIAHVCEHTDTRDQRRATHDWPLYPTRPHSLVQTDAPNRPPAMRAHPLPKPCMALPTHAGSTCPASHGVPQRHQSD
eukprot:4889329-Prymnesium_polylepis.1